MYNKVNEWNKKTNNFIRLNETQTGFKRLDRIENVDIYIDNSLLRFDFLFAAAGHPNCIFKINFSDLKKITKGTIEDITE